MEDRWIADWPPSKRWPHYTRSNAGEVLATPASPLGQQFEWDNAIVLGMRDGFVRQGYFVPGEMAEQLPETLGFFGGYLYINLSNIRMQGVRSPVVTVEQLDMAFFGDHPDVPPYIADPRDDNPDLVPGILKHLGWVMSATSWPEIDDEKAEMKALRRNRPDLVMLSDDELVARARSLQPWLRKLFDSHTVSSSSSGIAPGILYAVGQAIGDPTVPMKLLSGLGDVDSAEPNYALWELSRMIRASEELTEAFAEGVDGLPDRLAASGSADAKAFLTAFDEFLVEFGSRGPERMGDQRRFVGDQSSTPADHARSHPPARRQRVTAHPQCSEGHRAAPGDRGGAGQGRAARRGVGRPIRGRLDRRQHAGVP